MAATNITELHESMGSDIDERIRSQKARHAERQSHEAPLQPQPKAAPMEPKGGWKRAG